jgi:signal transduction histidine kinase
MKLPERALALTPKRWPIRWRLAAVSAGLTLIILVIFALVVGRLTSNRLQANLDDELKDETNRVAFELGATGGHIVSRDLQRMTAAGTVLVRVVYPNGAVRAATAPDLGPPRRGIYDVGSLRVDTVPIPGTSVPPLFLQAARSTDSLNSTVARLWLFLGLGVLGGTALAALAGIAIAGRAMRPIAALTASAREVAFTRDPSRRIPEPDRDDEVGELARTLDQMLRELDAARAETEQMMHLQREFVADASHELRTPLTSILANLELLQERLESADPSGEDAEMVDSALRSSRRMSRLVSDLLLLARADAGRSGTRRTCDLGEVVSAAVSEVRPVADGHILTVDELGSVPVQGNPDELHRLCVNLLDNGLRHTPEGSEIHVAVERRNGSAVIEVSDDGPGIPAGMEEQIFSRFVRGAGPADVAANTGTGLGLAIVKAVANSHGGDVEAGSSPEGGARFVVRLPAT